MSATLGTLLRTLDPALSIAIFERLDRVAAESSDAWNNAGTGHAGFCELNYTPERADGTVDVSKAVHISEDYELSRSFWAALVEAGDLARPSSFIREIPHLAFVRGDDDVRFLRARYEAMVASPPFAGMEWSDDPARVAEWVPLVMDGADRRRPVAATRMAIGTDVNFGALARALVERLDAQDGVDVHLGHEITDITREDGVWRVDVRDVESAAERTVRARLVFIGAGGYSLTLLERTGIPEAKGYGAFPVSGQWLRCTNRDVIARHEAKVYGKAAVGAPPMSVPHLDTRWIDGKRELLFGPYAGVTTRFLKQGSVLDLLKSVGIDNIRPVLHAGLANADLTRYLVGQALLSPEERVETLRAYCPSARDEDWELQIAGLRVQIIASDGHGGGELKFGTEVVTSADGSVAALLGASPGASTAVAIMARVIQRCFASRWKEWEPRCRALMPSLGRPLHDDAALCRRVRDRNRAVLGLGA